MNRGESGDLRGQTKPRIVDHRDETQPQRDVWRCYPKKSNVRDGSLANWELQLRRLGVGLAATTTEAKVVSSRSLAHSSAASICFRLQVSDKSLVSFAPGA